MGEGLEAVDEQIFRGDGGNCHCGMLEVDSVGDDNHLGILFDEGVKLVVVAGRANVEPVGATEVPGAMCSWFCMDEDVAPQWAQRCDIKIKRAGKVLPCRHRWLYL